MDTAKKITVGVVLPFVAIIALELLYRDSLFETSLNDIPLMQAKTKLRPLMERISFIGSVEANFLVLAFVSQLMSKPAFIYLISGVCFVQYVTETLKSFYMHPRPFWLSFDITSTQCLLGYGNPSRHLVSNTFLMTTLYLNAYYDIGVKSKRMSVFCTAYIIKMALTSLAFVYLILMMCSRVYLGAHAWNQVVYGASLGVGMGIVGHRSVKPWFYGLWERSMVVSENRFQLKAREIFTVSCFIAPFVLASITLFIFRIDKIPAFI